MGYVDFFLEGIHNLLINDTLLRLFALFCQVGIFFNRLVRLISQMNLLLWLYIFNLPLIERRQFCTDSKSLVQCPQLFFFSLHRILDAS